MPYRLSERLKKFSAQGIGLEPNSTRLEKFNPRWKRLYSDEAYLIFNELRDESLRLYHCGPTSKPGPDAPPVIEIVGSVHSLENLDSRIDRLKAIGYEWSGEGGSSRSGTLYDPEKTQEFVRLKLRQHGDPAIEEQLAERHGTQAPKKIMAIFAAAEGHKNTFKFLRELHPDAEVAALTAPGVNPYSYVQRHEDEFVPLVHKMLDSDLVVLATPVYWYSMSGPMKDFLDRFSDLLTGAHKELGEALCGKRIQVVSTGSDPNLPVGFEAPFSATAIYFGMDYLGARYQCMRG